MRWWRPEAAALVVALSSAVACAAPTSVDAGKAVFEQQCQSCHSVGPGAGNRIGPALNGLPGRVAGSIVGYGYSAALKRSGITWDSAMLARYVAAPRLLVPGTKMSYSGSMQAQEMADLLGFLSSLDVEGNVAPAGK